METSRQLISINTKRWKQGAALFPPNRGGHGWRFPLFTATFQPRTGRHRHAKIRLRFRGRNHRLIRFKSSWFHARRLKRMKRIDEGKKRYRLVRAAPYFDSTSNSPARLPLKTRNSLQKFSVSSMSGSQWTSLDANSAEANLERASGRVVLNALRGSEKDEIFCSSLNQPNRKCRACATP